MTCPIAKTATVTVTARPAPEFTITQIDPGLSKLAQALRRTSAVLALEPLEIRVEHWSDLDIGKGMGSSTADIVAAARALAAIAGQDLSPAQLAGIATSIESSDGSMYPGLIAFNQKTGEVVETFAWWPQFVILMITPAQVFNTESADFSGKLTFGTQFDEILASLRTAAAQRDTVALPGPRRCRPASTSGSSPTLTTRCWKTELVTSVRSASTLAIPAQSSGCFSTPPTPGP